MSTLSVYCDGGARGNPGPAAWGFVVKKNGTLKKEAAGFIGVATNNVAEYTALVEALKWLSQNFKAYDLNIYLDSQLVVLQMAGRYKVKNAKLRELIFKVRSLEANFGKISYRHIERAKNKEADRLVNIALNGAT
ncbi:hypothetical protein A3D81_02290 [Candidatus Curtissbacteria bacterium RIFCSPHIGHO2_02_FULL_40_17]|uniref:RNase H type-1 domain-containing protein n=4 Tax=Candidatus Curtissiibacteriota TaxID=1752717 RepID=A0A1F5GH64_9BACT|nr:MAG: hypothetical protein A2693_00125 [Candidatus Curtissbacteria bacterium RIFCSPHIGHO2_01_FULL_40_12]OGD91200.1 MAG: hypothetical protein A3D81_02290 [Candidatus Curtissbacteria bacterium RIFCSPHIGHO2_02_FULL_40_17]OGE03215.1 MAG: hypothetical protein A3F45_04240 [Candidatus Curtissbacteria bacterium RIFCSPHIGHO2_12_FULL_41_17]OGE06197.1 MAG: hypothetical protein A3I53_00565 [Candidatus Curtissbacteria bacterium RIFCSPLOWO2_02_FULL_40_13b]